MTAKTIIRKYYNIIFSYIVFIITLNFSSFNIKQKSLNFPSQIKKFPYENLIFIGQCVWQLYAIVVRYRLFRQISSWGEKDVCKMSDRYLINWRTSSLIYRQTGGQMNVNRRSRTYDSRVYVTGTDPDLFQPRTVNSAEFCRYNNNNNRRTCLNRLSLSGWLLIYIFLGSPRFLSGCCKLNSKVNIPCLWYKNTNLLD